MKTNEPLLFAATRMHLMDLMSNEKKKNPTDCEGIYAV